MKELEKALSVSLTTDSWVSVQKFNYVGVTCHFVNEEFQLKSYVLSIKHVVEKTTEAFHEHIIGIANDWKSLRN
jgi:hypothetical protein